MTIRYWSFRETRDTWGTCEFSRVLGRIQRFVVRGRCVQGPTEPNEPTHEGPEEPPERPRENGVKAGLGRARQSKAIRAGNYHHSKDGIVQVQEANASEKTSFSRELSIRMPLPE